MTTPRRSLLTIAFLFAVLAAVPTASARWQSSATTLASETSGRIGENRAVVVDANDRATVVWATAGGVVMFSRYAPVGSDWAWSAPAPVETPASGDKDLEPSAAVDANGDVVVVWYRNYADNTSVRDEIRAAIYDETAGTWSASQALVSADPSRDYAPQNASEEVFPMVQFTGDGKAVAGWGGARDGSPHDGRVFLAVRAGGTLGGTWGTATTLAPSEGSTQMRGVRIAADPADGTAMAVWQLGNHWVQWSRFDGNAWSASQTITTTGIGSPLPRVQALGGGDYMAVWHSRPDHTSTTFSVNAAVYDWNAGSSTGAWTTPEVLSTAPESANEPAIASDAAIGRALVTWASAASGPGEVTRVQAKIYTSTGTTPRTGTWSSAQTISGTKSAPGSARPIMYAGGSAVTFWSSGSEVNVVNEVGGAFTPPIRVGSGFFGLLAANPAGGSGGLPRGLTAVWTNEDSGVAGVYANRLLDNTPDAPTQPTVTARSGSLEVAWDAVVGMPRAIIQYTASASDGTATETCTVAAPATTCTIVGLSRASTYDVTVTATNASGVGPASPARTGLRVLSVPGAPAAATVTVPDVAGALDVSFTAPTDDGGESVTLYTATATDGTTTETCTSATAGSCRITGLARAATYTVDVTARSSIGTGPSTTAGSARPKSLPGAPTAVVANLTLSDLVVSWAAPTDDGGASIIEYVVTASPGNRTCITSATTCSILELDPRLTYTVSVVARSAVGAGVATSAESTMIGEAPASAFQSPEVLAAALTLVPWFRITDSTPTAQSGRTVRLRATTEESGRVTLVGRIAKRKPVICATTKRVRAAGDIALTCAVKPAALRRALRGSRAKVVPLRITTTFRSVSGKVKVDTVTIRLTVR